MERIGFWRAEREADATGLPHPSAWVDEAWPLRERVRVASYLRAGRPVAAYLGFSECRLACGLPWEHMGNRDLTDGSWLWPEGFAHYVEHHAVKPPAAFLAAIAPRLAPAPPWWWIGAAGRRAVLAWRLAAARREAAREARLPPETTPLHEAAQAGDVAALTAALAAMPVDAPNRLGDTALFVAARAGRLPVVRLLLARGADPNARRADELTPLCEAHGVDVVAALLDAGARIDPEPAAYCTPLTHAPAQGELDVVALLLARGADANRPDRFHAALAVAATRAIAERLLAHGADASIGTPLARAIRAGDRAWVELLIAHGADPSRGDGRRQTPMFHAASALGGDELVPLLLTAGADVARGNDLGDPPLHMACARTSLVTVDRLLAAGASVHTRSERGMTPLHWAALAEHRDGMEPVLRRLLAAGAGPLDARDAWGRTPLHIAVEKRDAVAVRVLREAGASLDARDADGVSVRELAERRGVPLG